MTERSDSPQPEAALPAGPKPGERDTTYFSDPMIDHLLRAVVTLTMEVSVSRERIQTLETMLAQTGALDRAAADAFEPDADEAVRRAQQRSKLIDDILGPMVSRLSRGG